MQQVQNRSASDPLNEWFRLAVLQLIDSHGRSELGAEAVARAKKMARSEQPAHARVGDLALVVQGGNLAGALAIVDELRVHLIALSEPSLDVVQLTPLTMVAEVAREGGEAIGAVAEGAAAPDSLPVVQTAIRELTEAVQAKERALAWFYNKKRRICALSMKPAHARRAQAARRIPT